MAAKTRKKKVAGKIRAIHRGKRGGEYYISGGRRVYLSKK